MLRALSLLFATTLAAAPPVLVELFTSQGCNSCPPADRLLAQLATEPGVIVLSEHVDYWNYLGWRDPYSDRQFSERQSRYAARLGRQGVYTPQAFIDGQREVLGSDERAVRRAISEAAQTPKATLEIAGVRHEGGRVTAEVRAPGAGTLWLALADERVEDAVTRGENSGHRLSHAAVVRVMRQVKPSQPVTLELPPGAGRSGLRVVAFQQDGQGRIVAAAQVQLAAN